MKMRKVLSLVLALVMVFSLAAPVMAAEKSAQEIAGDRLLSLGVIDGYADGTLGLDKTITRAEFCVILAKICGMGDAANLLKDTPSRFSDVKTGEWYTGWINLASSQGWVKGDPQGTFRPNDPVSHREIVTMLLKALGYDDNLPGEWPTNYLAKAAALGITKGIVSDSKAPAVRGDVFIMTSRTLDEETVSYDKDLAKFVESGKSLLVAKMDFEKIEGVVTDIPRVTSSLKDNQIRINGKTYKVVGSVDFEEVFGCDVDAWLNDDEEIVFIDIDSDEVLYDALKDVTKDELTLVDADDEYDIDEDVIFFVNGSKLTSSQIKNLNKASYDYAKVVLNEDGDVVFVDAYRWEDFIIVEKVDGTEVYAYGEEIDLEDYTVVKDGKTISVSDIEKGDILFYNSTAGDGYAEVFNKTVVGKMGDVHKSEFEVDNEEFTYDNHYATGKVQYFDEDGDLEDFDADAAKQMKDEGKDVTVYVDRGGNAVFVDGDLGVVEKSTIGAYLDDDILGYQQATRDRIELSVITESGKKVTYDVKLSDLDKISVDGVSYTIDNSSSTKHYSVALVDSNTDGKLDTIKLTPNAGGSAINIDLTTAGAEGQVVKLKVDADGGLAEIEFFVARTEESTTKFDIDDKYVKPDGVSSKKLQSSTVVFDATDADDVKVAKLSDLKDIEVSKAQVFWNSDNFVTYLVLKETDAQDKTDYNAFVTEVRVNSDDEVTRIKAFVAGAEKTYYTKDPAKISVVPEVGDVVVITVDDNTGKIIDIDNIDASKYLVEDVVVDTRNVSTSDRTVKAGSDTFKLLSYGYVLDATDLDDVELIKIGDLRNLDADNLVTIVLDQENTLFAEIIIVTKDGDSSSGGGSGASGKVAEYAGGSIVVYDGVAYAINSTTLLYAKNGTLIATGSDIITSHASDLKSKKAEIVISKNVDSEGNSILSKITFTE